MDRQSRCRVPEGVGMKTWEFDGLPGLIYQVVDSRARNPFLIRSSTPIERIPRLFTLGPHSAIVSRQRE